MMVLWLVACGGDGVPDLVGAGFRLQVDGTVGAVETYAFEVDDPDVAVRFWWADAPPGWEQAPPGGAVATWTVPVVPQEFHGQLIVERVDTGATRSMFATWSAEDADTGR